MPIPKIREEHLQLGNHTDRK